MRHLWLGQGNIHMWYRRGASEDRAPSFFFFWNGFALCPNIRGFFDERVLAYTHMDDGGDKFVFSFSTNSMRWRIYLLLPLSQRHFSRADLLCRLVSEFKFGLWHCKVKANLAKTIKRETGWQALSTAFSLFDLQFVQFFQSQFILLL